MVTMLLCKDCINGKSAGKRIMKIEIANEKEGEKVSAVSCIVRFLQGTHSKHSLCNCAPNGFITRKMV